MFTLFVALVSIGAIVLIAFIASRLIDSDEAEQFFIGDSPVQDDSHGWLPDSADVLLLEQTRHDMSL